MSIVNLSVFCILCSVCFFFFFNDTATTEIYTLSLHDALPISRVIKQTIGQDLPEGFQTSEFLLEHGMVRSEEHTSELQSQSNLVCRLLLEKKKKKNTRHSSTNLTLSTSVIRIYPRTNRHK